MKKIISIFVILFVTSFSLMAQNYKRGGNIHVFAYGNCLNDSIVYMTEVLPVSNAWYQTSNKFLYARNEYGIQLRNHLYNIGISNATVVTSFGMDRAKAEKKYIKTRSKLQKSGFTIRYIPASDFTFTGVEYSAPVIED